MSYRDELNLLTWAWNKWQIDKNMKWFFNELLKLSSTETFRRLTYTSLLCCLSNYSGFVTDNWLPWIKFPASNVVRLQICPCWIHSTSLSSAVVFLPSLSSGLRAGFMKESDMLWIPLMLQIAPAWQYHNITTTWLALVSFCLQLGCYCLRFLIFLFWKCMEGNIRIVCYYDYV